MYLTHAAVTSQDRAREPYMFFMYLDIFLQVFYTYPIGVQDTFGIHIRYIKIHVSYALP